MDEDEVQQLVDWFEQRLRSVDQQIDATRNIIDHHSFDTTRQLDILRQDLLRRIFFAVTVCAVITVMLCLATLVVLI